ncbi:MAG: extracellular solute-binding protein, partial [Defluviitaleaceae bacterium]|nr:extracellular solute-binding protein [Defluviitaleaceae bacterium]
MRLNKLSFVAALTVLLFVVLSGCDAIGGGTSGATAAGFERTAWNEPFPETITVTIANHEDPGHSFVDGDVLHHQWHRRWYESFNINVETDWVSSDYDLNMNLAIAAGNLPDMFHVNAVQFGQLLDANLIEDIHDFIRAPYTSPGLLRLLEAEQDVFDTTMRDGRSYSVPRLHFGHITQAPFLWVRNDWYIEAGSPEINTIADLENLMDTFMNTHGSSFAITLDSGLNSFWHSTPAWHSHARGANGSQRMWVDDGAGGIMSAYEQPEMLDVLAAWRDWYDRGWVREDFATIDWDMMNSDIISGNVGIEFGQNWKAMGLGAMVENFGEESYMIAFAIPTVDGALPQIPIHFANEAYNVVRRGFEHPEVLPILISDYFHVLNEASVQGTLTVDEVLVYTSGNAHHAVGPFRVVIPHYDDVVAVRDALITGEANFTTGNATRFHGEIMLWINDRDLAGLGRYTQQGNPRAG